MAKRRKIDAFLNILLAIGIALSSLAIVTKTTFMKIVVNGNSMNPTIEDGTVGYMIKVNEYSKLNRFDVVACDLDESGFYIIKRIVGLPNEKVQIQKDKLIVNGVEVIQDFRYFQEIKDYNDKTYTLSENQYLIVGDNRKATIDPKIINKNVIVAKNGFAISKYDVTSEKCKFSSDYSSCPIENRKWYGFKYGK